MAVAAGLVTCLNASAAPPDARRFVSDELPEMPDAEFSLLPPKPNRPALVGEVKATAGGAIRVKAAHDICQGCEVCA